VGPADFTRKDALGLARYLKKYVVAFPVVESGRVVLVIPEYMWRHLIFFKSSYDKSTYVAFMDSGEVTVRIAKKDYLKYREELTFDQLCASLGDLFKRFMLWYKTKEPGRILDELNSV
jgi:hypothetical protein